MVFSKACWFFVAFFACATLPVAAGAEDLLTPRLMPETCTIINGIRVCDRPYVPGEYVCGDFARDFQEECEEAGIPCHLAGVGVCLNLVDEWNRTTPPPVGHVLNIIEIEPPYGIVNDQFCLVEPQSNTNLCCWYQLPGGDPLPPQRCTDIVRRRYPVLVENYEEKPLIWTIE